MLATLLTQYNLDGSVVPASGYIANRSGFGRQPFVFVEIDLDFCANTFGSSPCTAVGSGDAKCFNTFATCKDTPNFNRITKTYRFCSRNGGALPDGLDAIPCLDAISHTPATIDPKNGIGLRASMTVTMQDFAHSDIRIDPYVTERTYQPIEQGTFFGRLRARNPYYNGRVMRVYSGYLTEQGAYVPSNFERRTFFIESWAGLSADGKVQITGKDALKLASDDRAVYPRPSQGKLSANISAAATSATLTPATVGDDYDTEGFVRIGSEVMSYTRVGDVLTFVDRGMGGTSAEEHKAGDTVQLCGWIDGEKSQDIVYELLTDGANVDPTYIDKSGWDAEQVGFLPRRYSALITAPTGVSKLISELAEQVGFFVYWDEVAELIRFKAIRPNTDSEIIYDLTESENLLADSIKVRDVDDLRVNEVHVFYGVIDTTKNLTDETNYKVIWAGVNLADQGTLQNNDLRIKSITSRWIPETNGAAAIELANRYLARYGRTPREVDFVVDAKDSAIQLADFVRITNRQTQDMYGLPQSLLLQVIKRKEALSGTTWTYTAREFAFDTVANDGIRRINIDADVANIDLRELHDSLFDAPTAGVEVLVTIGFDVLVYGDPDLSGYFDFALRTGDWPDGVVLALVVNGYIAGAGGNGTSFMADAPSPPYSAAATDGRDGMTASYPISVQNNGVIAGGGGGGGGGSASGFSGAWGGGGGAPLGIGGSSNGAASAQNGGRVAGGAGISTSGKGGDLGQNGSNGAGVVELLRVGGLAGRAIVDPDGYITLTGSGQVLGS